MSQNSHQQEPKSYDPDLYKVPVCCLFSYAGISDALHYYHSEKQRALKVGSCVALKETVYHRILVKGRCCPFSGYRAHQTFYYDCRNYNEKYRKQYLTYLIHYLSRIDHEPVCDQIVNNRKQNDRKHALRLKPRDLHYSRPGCSAHSRHHVQRTDDEYCQGCKYGPEFRRDPLRNFQERAVALDKSQITEIRQEHSGKHHSREYRP